MKSVFVSSTFKDMHFERDVIHEKVSSELNALAKKYGDSVSFCDLRWGVNTIDLDSDAGAAKVLDVCLDEIDRCRPYIVVIVGARYGWIPDETLITNSIQGRNLYLEELEKSVTALEIEYGALRDPEQLDHAFFYFRDIQGDSPDIYKSEGERAKAKLDELKERIRCLTHGRVKEYSVRWNQDTQAMEGIDTFAEMLISDMRKALLPEWEVTKNLTPFQKERKVHESMARRKEFPLSARDDIVEMAIGEIEAGVGLFAFMGDSGIGKSALMSRLSTRLEDRGFIAAPLFCGTTINSNDALDVVKYETVFLEEALRKLEECDPIENFSRPSETDFEEWRNLLIGHVARYNESALPPIVFVIDAINQLAPSEERDSLKFLPSVLEGKIQVVISCTTDYVLTRPCRGLRLEPLNSNERENVIAGVLRASGRELDDDVIAAIMAKRGSDLPLYLGLVVQRLTMMKKSDFDEIVARGDGMTVISEYQQEIVRKFPENTSGACKSILEAASERIGGSMVMAAAKYIAASRHGLRETDLEWLLGKEGIPWSGLNFSMFLNYLSDFFFQRDDGRFDFAHHAIRKGVLADECVDLGALHASMLELLSSLENDDPVRVQEIGYHCICADDKSFFAEYLLKFHDNPDISNPFGKDAREHSVADGGNWLVAMASDQASAGYQDRLPGVIASVVCRQFLPTKCESAASLNILAACRDIQESHKGEKSQILKEDAIDVSLMLAGACQIVSGFQNEERARLVLGSARRVCESLMQSDPSSENYRRLTDCYLKLARNSIENGDHESAYLNAMRSVETSERWVKECPVEGAMKALADGLTTAAHVMMEIGTQKKFGQSGIKALFGKKKKIKEISDGMGFVSRAIDVQNNLLAIKSCDEYVVALAETRLLGGELLDLNGEQDSAQGYYDLAFEDCSKIDNPWNPGFVETYVRCCRRVRDGKMTKLNAKHPDPAVLKEALLKSEDALVKGRYLAEVLGTERSLKTYCVDECSYVILSICAQRWEKYDEIAFHSRCAFNLSKTLQSDYGGAGSDGCYAVALFVAGALAVSHEGSYSDAEGMKMMAEAMQISPVIVQPFRALFLRQIIS